MRAVAVVAFTTALALGIIAAAVFGGHDGALFVPPPEAVAEEFSRALAQERYTLVRPLLSRASPLRNTPGLIDASFASIAHDVGEVDRVSAQTESADGSRARARALLQGRAGSAVLSFTLVREHGLWVVDTWARVE